MDLFGRERKRLREQLTALERERDDARQQADEQAKKAKALSRRAGERQDKLEELQRIIDDLKAEVAQRKIRGAPSAQIAEAETALRDAQAIHSESTR